MKRSSIIIAATLCMLLMSCTTTTNNNEVVYILNSGRIYDNFVEAYDNHISSQYLINHTYNKGDWEVEVLYINDFLELQISRDDSYIHEISISFFEDSLDITYNYLDDFFKAIGLNYNTEKLNSIITELTDTEFVEFDDMWFFIHKYETYSAFHNDEVPRYWLKISYY